MRVPSIYNFLYVKFKTGSVDLRLRSQDGDCGGQGRVVTGGDTRMLSGGPGSCSFS